MLDIGADNKPDPVCFFSLNRLPQSIDDKQISQTRKPFSIIRQFQSIHTIDIITPSNALSTLQRKLESTLANVHYARVFLKLKDLLEPDFFNYYVKQGNVLMLAKGQNGVHDNFSLHEGILRLEVGRPVYERLGLMGKPIDSHGRKHKKSRYVIELNLRLPSMVRGRPLFNRMVYAFENVLNETLTWLFYDLQDTTMNIEKQIESSVDPDKNEKLDGKVPGHSSTPIARHCPIRIPLHAKVSTVTSVKVPTFPKDLSEDHRHQATDMLEWLSIAMIESPRMVVNNSLDEMLSRWDTPDLRCGEDGETSSKMTTDVSHLRYHAFLPGEVALQIYIAVIRATKRLADTWSAIRLQSFDGRQVMIFLRGDVAFTWQYT